MLDETYREATYGTEIAAPSATTLGPRVVAVASLSKCHDAAVDRFYAALGRHGVRVAPGPWFGEATRVFRLGFGLLPGAELTQALEGVSAALQA